MVKTSLVLILISIKFPSSEFHVKNFDNQAQNSEFQAKNLDNQAQNLEFQVKKLDNQAQNLEFQVKSLDNQATNLEFQVKKFDNKVQNIKFQDKSFDNEAQKLFEDFLKLFKKYYGCDGEKESQKLVPHKLSLEISDLIMISLTIAFGEFNFLLKSQKYFGNYFCVLSFRFIFASEIPPLVLRNS